jgi:hypothetical protein
VSRLRVDLVRLRPQVVRGLPRFPAVLEVLAGDVAKGHLRQGRTMSMRGGKPTSALRSTMIHNLRRLWMQLGHRRSIRRRRLCGGWIRIRLSSTPNEWTKEKPIACVIGIEMEMGGWMTGAEARWCTSIACVWIRYYFKEQFQWENELFYWH